MKTIALILACVSAMVCFEANAGEPAGAFESSKVITAGEVPAESWFLYNTPTEPLPAGSYVADIDKEGCKCRGIRLYGKVKVVESFADLKVKVVESFPDLKVKTVSSFADDCGKWQFVESFPDFTIQYVESFPDLKIKFVESFPGM